MKLDQSYEKRIISIEQLLKKHGKIILNNDSILSKHIVNFNAFVEELRISGIEIQEDLETNNTKICKELVNHQNSNIADFKSINEKLDTILNIKVNGTTGLENVLRLVYESTKTHRASNNVSRAIREWFDCHKTLKLVFTSRTGLIILTFILTNIIQMFGVKIIDISKLF